MMIHIFPYWDFNDGQIIDVCVATNAPKVELQLNVKTIWVKEIDHQHGRELVPVWKLPFEEGELKAIAYDKKLKGIRTISFVVRDQKIDIKGFYFEK